jgi:RNA polymerase sigma factor (sigma-70 family)
LSPLTQRLMAPLNVGAAETAIRAQDEADARQWTQHGDARAFEALVRRHQGAVRAYLRRLTHPDTHVADDLAQDTFLRALRALGSFRAESSLRTWLMRIALSTWQDHHRRPSVWTVSADAMGVEGEHDEGRDSASNLAAFDPRLADAVAQQVDVEQALARLNPAEREVVVHAYWGDLSQSEIASALGLPLGTVKTHHRRGLHKLAAALGAP